MNSETVTRTDSKPADGDDDAPPIDWKLAERVAVRTCGRSDYARTPDAVTMPAEFDSLTQTSQSLVEDFTGLYSPDGPARAEVIDRPRWIRANIAGFRHILEPIAETITHLGSHAPDSETGDREAAAAASGNGTRLPGMGIGSKVLAVEMGLLLGFLSQRVLGQYDLLLTEEAAAEEGSEAAAAGNGDGVVYYVGPNIEALERTYGFNPRDFRLWIALHEVTHRTQFSAVPWLRPYFLSLVDDGLATFDLNPEKLIESLGELVAKMRRGEKPLDRDGLMSLFASPEQRAALDKMQGLMTLLEGHGNFVMDTVGKDHVVGQEEMSNILRKRRRQGGLSKIVMRLMGMDMKARQYEEGQKWIGEVVDDAGLRGLDPAWETSDNLPSLDELRSDPAGWLSRVVATSPV